jgi:hypothetical protein
LVVEPIFKQALARMGVLDADGRLMPPPDDVDWKAVAVRLAGQLEADGHTVMTIGTVAVESGRVCLAGWAVRGPGDVELVQTPGYLRVSGPGPRCVMRDNRIV